MLIRQMIPTDPFGKRRTKEEVANRKIDKKHKQKIHRDPMANKQIKRCPASKKINEKQMNAIIRYFFSNHTEKKDNNLHSQQGSEKTGSKSIYMYNTFGEYLAKPKIIDISIIT